MAIDQVVDDHATADQMFLNDSLEDGWIARAIPGPFGIDDCDRAAFADAKAIRFRPQDAALLRQAELLQPALEEFPRRQTAFLLAALRVGLIAAEKNVPPRDGHADALCDCFEWVHIQVGPKLESG